MFGWFCVNTIVASLFLPSGAYDPYIKRILRRLFQFLFIPVRVEGRRGLDPGRPYLYMSNHVSLFDMPLLGGWVPGVAALRGGGAAVPLAAVRPGRASAGEHPHPPGGRVRLDAQPAQGRCAGWASAGRLLIMPEGSRTMDGKLRPFKRLPFLLAKQAGVDLVPVGMSGLFSLKNKRSWRIRPGPLKLKFGEVIPAATVARLSIEELRDLTQERIQELVEWP